MRLTATMEIRLRLATIIVLCCALMACPTAQPPIARELLVGNYSYHLEDPAPITTDHNLNHLVLRSDGTYDLLQGGATKTVSETKGAWRITSENPPNVVLDHAGYPIEIKENEVRLLIDLDTGIWWVKTK